MLYLCIVNGLTQSILMRRGSYSFKPILLGQQADHFAGG